MTTPSTPTPEGDAVSRAAVLDAITSHAHFDEDWGDLVVAIRSLPPQDGEREEIERLTAELGAMTNRAEVSEYKRRIVVEEVQPMIIARAEKAEAALAERDAEIAAMKAEWSADLVRAGKDRRAALTAQPVAQEVVAWQWRSRIKGGAWDAWESGRYGSRRLVHPLMEIEERPLYTHPAPVEAGLGDEVEKLIRRAETEALMIDAAYSVAERAKNGPRLIRELVAALRAQSAPVGGEVKHPHQCLGCGGDARPKKPGAYNHKPGCPLVQIGGAA